MGSMCILQLGWPKASGRWSHVLGVPITSPLSSDPGRGCRCNKHLAKCDHRIAPHEVKYQLHNVDSRMLLHCNCTHRLARCLHRARHCSDMDVAVLADRITMNCFVLELPAACSPGRGSQNR